MLHLSKKIDRLFSGSFRKQVFVLFIAALLFLIFWTITVYLVPGAGNISEGGKQRFDPFWWVLLHFTDPSNLALEIGTQLHVRILAWLITFSGLLIFEGLLIGIIVHGLRNRVEISKNGLARYNFNNHLIILGGDIFVVSLIQRLFYENAGSKSIPEIVVLSTKNAEGLQHLIKSRLTSEQNKKVYVFFGDLISEEFRKLSLNNSNEIYIIGDSMLVGINNKNLGIIYKIAEIIDKNRRIDCYLNLPEPETFNLIKKFPFPELLTKKLNIRPFNLNQGWARILWGSIDSKTNIVMKDEIINENISLDDPLMNLVGSFNTFSYLNIVIIGFNEMANALLEHTLQMAHFNTNEPTQISVIDNSIGGKEDRFKAEFPGYNEINDCRISFFEGDIYNEKIRKQLLEWERNKDCRLVIFVCKTNPDISFSIASLLPRELIEKNLPVFICQHEGKGYFRLLNYSGAHKSEPTSNIRFFGWLNEHCELIKTRERLAEGIHLEYIKLAKKDGSYDPTKQNFFDWDNLPELYKWSNRYQADSYIIKLSRINRKLVPHDDSWKLAVFTQPEIEILARMEHDRWCAERILNGWQYGAVRDNNKKIHPDLVPFDTLPKKTQEYDYYAVNSIPFLLHNYCKLDIIHE